MSDAALSGGGLQRVAHGPEAAVKVLGTSGLTLWRGDSYPALCSLTSQRVEVR